MNDKSHVSLEQRCCQACGATYDTGAILLDKRLRASMERHTVTGWGLCPEHQQLFSDGFIALIEFDPVRSGEPSKAAQLRSADAFRTGRLAHIKREAFTRVFGASIDENQACVFVELGVLDRLMALQDSAPV